MRDVDEGTVDEPKPGAGGVADQAGVGHAQRLGDPGVHLVGPRVAGDLFDDLAEDDVVGVGVVVRAARLAHPSGRLGDGDQLGRRPLALRVVDALGRRGTRRGRWCG